MQNFWSSKYFPQHDTFQFGPLQSLVHGYFSHAYGNIEKFTCIQRFYIMAVLMVSRRILVQNI
jgi:hypothetical protein